MATQQLLARLNTKNSHSHLLAGEVETEIIFSKVLIFPSSPPPSLSPAMWCQEMQMESSTFGIGRPPSCTTGSKLTIRCASAPCGIHMKRPRSSLAVGMGRSNCGIRSVCGRLFLETERDWLSPGFCERCLSESHKTGIQSYCSSVFLYPVMRVQI